jgi:septal ring-binding cell division protein DamX
MLYCCLQFKVKPFCALLTDFKDNCIAEPSSVEQDHISEPATADHISEPATADHISEPATADHISEPATADHISEPATAAPIDKKIKKNNNHSQYCCTYCNFTSNLEGG